MNMQLQCNCICIYQRYQDLFVFKKFNSHISIKPVEQERLMDIDEEEEPEEKFFLSQKEKEQIKQKLLDEDFKKTIHPKKMRIKI